VWQSAQRTGAIPGGRSLTFGHVACQSGANLLGGGYLTNGRAYATSSAVLSLPDSSGTSWGAEAANPQFLGQPGPFIITADCLTLQRGGTEPPVTGFVTAATIKTSALAAGVTERGTASCDTSTGSTAKEWFVTGGGFDVGTAVTSYPIDTYPASDSSWSTTEYNNGSGLAGTMRVQAECMKLLRQPNHRAMTGIVFKTAISPQVAVRHDGVSTVTERCPAGASVLSGGWWLDPSEIDPNSAPHVLSSGRVGTSSWRVTVLNPPSGTSGTDFSVLAICATPQY
jgi:hypothetical protein